MPSVLGLKWSWMTFPLEAMPMRSAGIWMLILGVGGFILPLIGIQFRLLSVFGEGQSYVAGGLAVLGLILLVLSFVSQSEKPEAE